MFLHIRNLATVSPGMGNLSSSYLANGEAFINIKCKEQTLKTCFFLILFRPFPFPLRHGPVYISPRVFARLAVSFLYRNDFHVVPSVDTWDIHAVSVLFKTLLPTSIF